MRFTRDILREEAGIVPGADGDAGAGDAAGNAEPWYSKAGFSDEILADEGFKNLAGKYKSPDDFAKGTINLSKKIGEKGLTVPGEDASDEERAEFYNKLGRPEAPDKYSWKAPEGFEVDQEIFAERTQQLHEAGLTDSQHKAVMDLYQAEMERLGEQAQTFQTEVAEKTEGTLREEWGESYDSNVKQAAEVAKKFGVIDSLKESGIINDLGIIKMLHQVAISTKEGGIDFANGGTSAKEQAEALRKSDAYKDRLHPDHKKVMKQIVDLAPV